MSCCGGNCGCGSGCNCGSGCGGCKMFPDLGGERGATTAGIIDLGAAAQKGQVEGFEIAEGGDCNCNTCKCGTSCSCACCGCN